MTVSMTSVPVDLEPCTRCRKPRWLHDVDVPACGIPEICDGYIPGETT